MAPLQTRIFSQKIGKINKGDDMYYVILTKLREKRGLSIRQLALYSGVSRTTISKIEQNAVSPTLYTLELLSHSLKCNIKDTFVEGNNVFDEINNED